MLTYLKMNFRRLLLLIFIVILAPSWSDAIDNADENLNAAEEIKAESCKDNSDEKDRDCITFHEGKGINHVDEFILMNPHMEEWTACIFSAKYDLNDDGNDEYFYYIENPAFCGTMLGCPINVYEYKDGEFRELLEYGIFADNFYGAFVKKSWVPSDVGDWDYICIEDKKDFAWKRLHNKKTGETYFYNGQEYISLKLKSSE